eukprot:SAG31_NODE_42592_length_271_cov_0.552326_1_plen_89_part_11
MEGQHRVMITHYVSADGSTVDSTGASTSGSWSGSDESGTDPRTITIAKVAVLITDNDITAVSVHKNLSAMTGTHQVDIEANDMYTVYFD